MDWDNLCYTITCFYQPKAHHKLKWISTEVVLWSWELSGTAVMQIKSYLHHVAFYQLLMLVHSYRDAVIIWLFSIQCHQGVADIAQEFSEKKPSPQDTTIYHTWTAYKKKQTSWIGWSYSITTVYIQFMPGCTLILIFAIIFPTTVV